MKHTIARIAAALGLLFFGLHAQAVCTHTGEVTPFRVSVNDAGFWAVRWATCKEGGYEQDLRVMDMVTVTKLLNAQNSVDAGLVLADAMTNKLPLTDPRMQAVIAPDADYIASTKPIPPSPWTVAKFSVQTTRPAFPVVAGKRSATSTARATVGAACDCTTPLVEGLVTYCPAAGIAPLVTVCSK